MIKFKQKDFVAPMLVATLASTGLSMGQGAIQNKKNMEQQEDFQRQNERLQKKQAEAINKLAKAAEKDPSKAQQAAGVLQQQAFSLPAGIGKALRTGGQTVYEFARAINKSGGGHQIAKKVGSGLAMGATMAAGSYVLDKAIQADRKKITGGAPLPKPEVNPEEAKKKRNKTLLKVAGTGAALAGTVIAARKGALGKGLQNLSHLTTSSGKKLDLNPAKKVLSKEFKSGMTGKAALGGLGFAAMFNLPGYLAERKQLKEQAAVQQQKQYSEENQQQPQRSRGSVLGKVALGTAATIGTVAALRRIGPAGMRKSLNDMYMTYGKKLAGKAGNGKLGNWMMKSGANEYGKAVVKARNAQLAKAGKAAINLDPTKIGQGRLAKIQSGKTSRKVGEGLLSGINSVFGIKSKGVNTFMKNMATNPNNSEFTRKTADFLSKHHRTALVGGAAIGSLAWKPFEAGDKAVRGATKAIDKNAFAYEKSKEQKVE